MSLKINDSFYTFVKTGEGEFFYYQSGTNDILWPLLN